jgi:hypothetical protein
VYELYLKADTERAMPNRKYPVGHDKKSVVKEAKAQPYAREAVHCVREYDLAFDERN